MGVHHTNKRKAPTTDGQYYSSNIIHLPMTSTPTRSSDTTSSEYDSDDTNQSVHSDDTSSEDIEEVDEVVDNVAQGKYSRNFNYS